MAMNWEMLKNRFRGSNITVKIVAIHFLIYVLSLLWRILIFRFTGERLQHYFALPASPSELLRRPWTLLTYSFFHADLIHLLFNSLFLILAGRLFLTFFSWRAFLKFYFLGALGAALVYLIGVNVWGYASGYLYGSSAATMSVFFAVTAYRPDMVFHFPFVGRILLKRIAVFLLVMDLLLLLDASNVGGRLSHLGGAILGFLYMRQFEMGRDILNFSYWGKRWKRKIQKLIVSGIAAHNRRKMDKILGKLSRSGYESLSKEEKELLFHIGRGNGSN